ncbi:hypothetical protein [Mycolicibacterium palauense]|uniref:hypothetical protein n=1 Tax=Mycolicibacterium palauense TaxID=2034511 RepID=UPI000BFF025A|nr:hypothetical protein [Mycolicibacterium palauense]
MNFRTAIPLRLAATVLAAIAPLAACAPDSSRGGEAARTEAGNVIVNDKSVQDLLQALREQGLAVPNPRDVTDSACADIGCVTEIDTDTVDILKFPSTGKAEIYAGQHHDVFLVTDTVVRFDPDTPEAERDAYRQAVKQAIQ